MLSATAAHQPTVSALSTLSPTAIPAPASGSSQANASSIHQNYGKFSLSFEANVGQADAQVQFLAHGPGYGLYLTGSEAVMVLSSAQGSGARGQGSVPSNEAWPVGQPFQPDGAGQAGRPELQPATADIQSTVVRMQVLDGNAGVQAVGEQQQPGIVNYFLGNDPSQWHTHIATYARVTYPNIYPGIALAYYGSQQQLEYDFVVAPGADPSQIRLGFAGADQVAVDGRGDLVVHAGGQDIHQHKPVVYQNVNGARREIPSAFTVTADQSPLATQEVAFAVGAYDISRPLVIDPVLSYSTYLGGSGGDYGNGIAVDPTTGDALVTGVTNSPDFPTANPLQPNFGGYADAFVARVRADGSALVYSTYLGGSSLDKGFGIAVDPATGDALVTGFTHSMNFPTANPLQPTNHGTVGNAFVARLSADGSALVYSTYLGGSGWDEAYGIAVDPATGDALVTGYTNSTDFPTANPLQPNFGGGGGDAFVARLRADGSALVYSTYLGGSGGDLANGIAVDPTTGDALVTGQTNSTNFPTANPFQPTIQGFPDAFVARLRADGSALVFSTYLGGSLGNVGYGIAVDPTTGDALVTGATSSPDFPTANPFQSTNHGGDDAFVARLSADGSALVFSTYLGGSAGDVGDGIAVDPATGDALVTGYTNSPDFPTANPFQPTNHSLVNGHNAFVARLSADGSALVYSTYLGGSYADEGQGIAVDPTTGDALVTGSSRSTDFPTANAFQSVMGGTGIFKSINGGGNWSPSNSGLTNSAIRVIALDPSNPSTTYAGTFGGGVNKSTNAGMTWSASNIGLTNLSLRALVIDPMAPAVLYVGTNGSGIFNSADGGASWNPRNIGLPTLFVSALVIDPSTPTTLYVSIPLSGVFKSINSGMTWTLSNSGLDNAEVVTLAIDPGTPSTLYAGTNYNGVYKSINGGGIWTPSNTGLPSTEISALAIDPATPATLYVGIHYYDDYFVYKSTDNGGNWSSSNSGLPNAPVNVFAIDPLTPSTLYAGTGSGVYKSVNSGTSWSSSGLTNITVQALSIDPATPATVYAGSPYVSPASNAFVTKISG
jgi:hypothetical protein